MPPRLSIVIPYVNRADLLSACLERLDRQSARGEMEVIVCDRLHDGAPEAMAQRYEFVRVETAAADEPIPALRWRGARAAKGEFVAVLEDHSMAPPAWAANVLAAHGRGLDALGGPVENESRQSLFDWAFFLLEYSSLMPPVAAGPVAGVAGGNASYRRSLLPLDDERFARRWETELFEHLRREGVEPHLLPEMLIEHRNPCEFWEFWEQRRLFSRSIAAIRAETMPAPRRIVMGAAALAVLPLLIPFRLARTVWEKGRYRKEFLLSLPLIALFTISGVLGEAAGFWFGDGGSLQKVR